MNEGPSRDASGGHGQRPNILLIMSDQHQAAIMGCAGDPVVRTPNMDRLAAEGVRFDEVYCQGPLCMPARASFLTERYVRDHGVFQNNWDTPTTLPTFVEALRDSGYHTSCIGKMHLWRHGGRGPDGRRTHHTRERLEQMRSYGFVEPIETVGKLACVGIGSEYSDYLVDRGLYETYQEWVAERAYGPSRINGRDVHNLPIWTTSSNPVTGDDYIDTWHGRRVARWIDEYQRPEPFFQWVGFPGPHDPWDAPKDYVDLYRGDIPMPASLSRPEVIGDERFQKFLGYFMNVHSDSANLSDEVIADVRRHYYANVTLIDDAIGRILDALERRGLLENTWVIYTSDHGEMMGQHRLLTKMVFYDEAVKIPLIIRPPKGCPPQTVTTLFEQVDLAATMRMIAGAVGHPTFEGRTLLDTSSFQPTRGRVAVFSENFGLGMVRTREHKLVFLEDDLTPCQLFDLVADPQESQNVVASQSCSAVRDELIDSLVAPFMGPGPVKYGRGILERAQAAAKA